MIETMVNLTIDLTGARGAIIEAEKRFNECAEAREWGEACGHAVDGFGAGKVALNAVIATLDHQARQHLEGEE